VARRAWDFERNSTIPGCLILIILVNIKMILKIDFTNNKQEMFLFIIFTASSASACSNVGTSCQTNSDCCPDLCSPTSCFQGMCIGSTCLADGNFCETDCQCCSSACIKNDANPGTCGVPSLKQQANLKSNTKSKNFTNLDVGSCCSAGDCNVDGTSCNICCPVGSASHCDSNACNCWCTSGAIISTFSQFSSTNGYNIATLVLISVSVLTTFMICVTLIIMTKNKQIQYIPMK
jgi:hypothetical protein